MSRAWLVPSYLIALLMGGGLLAANRGWLPPPQGFTLFFAGGALALVGAVTLGGSAALGAALGKPWRRAALLGAVLPLAVTLWIVGGRMQNPVPPIHDITTDLADPPTFSFLAAEEQRYDAESVGAMQRQGYPEVQPSELDEGPGEAYDRALATALSMENWEVIRSDSEGGVIEAVATSSLFRFRDDVVIRVRPAGSGARVDLRSRSRFGQSDLGANAARILAFQRSLEQGVAGR